VAVVGSAIRMSGRHRHGVVFVLSGRVVYTLCSTVFTACAVEAVLPKMPTLHLHAREHMQNCRLVCTAAGAQFASIKGAHAVTWYVLMSLAAFPVVGCLCSCLLQGDHGRMP